MPKFNLNDYIDVQDRINRFWNENPDGAIRTTLLSDPNIFDQVVFRSDVYKHRDNPHPDATGIAAEAKGQGGMANSTSWHENGETSAIGRALANMGYATSGKDRPSRQEMSKVEHAAHPNVSVQSPQRPSDAPKPANATPDTPAPKDMRAEALGRTLHGLAEHDFLHALAVKWGFTSFADLPADNRQLALDYLNGKGEPAKLQAFHSFRQGWEEQHKRASLKPQANGLLPGVDQLPNPRPTADHYTDR